MSYRPSDRYRRVCQDPALHQAHARCGIPSAPGYNPLGKCREHLERYRRACGGVDGAADAVLVVRFG
jgi:hypothetical protein